MQMEKDGVNHRNSDANLTSDPSAKIDWSQFWVFDKTRERRYIQKEQRYVYPAICLICRGQFESHRDMKEHCQACMRRKGPIPKQLTLEKYALSVPKLPMPIVPEQRLFSRTRAIQQVEMASIPGRTEPREGLTNSDRALLDFICGHALPLSPFTGTDFDLLLRVFHSDQPSYSYVTLRNKMLDYAEEVRYRTLSSLHGDVVSLMVDGGTQGSKHWLAIGLFSKFGTDFYGLSVTDGSSSELIAKEVASCIDHLRKFHIEIAAAVTDNASNMIAAFDRARETSVQGLTGCNFIRSSCACHTAQLALKDMATNGPMFRVFRNELKELIDWLHLNKVRKELSRINVREKAPEIIATRWNYEFMALQFVIKYKRQITQVMGIEIGNLNPPLPLIPDSWEDIMSALRPLKDFSDACENQRSGLVEQYKAYEEALAVLRAMSNNEYATALSHHLQDRFTRTADAQLAHLAYVLTPKGLQEWRELWKGFEPAHPPRSQEDRERFNNLFREELALTTKFNEVFLVYHPRSTENRTLMLRYWLHILRVPEETDPRALWMRLSVEDDVVTRDEFNRPVAFSWTNMALVAQKLLTIPPSESACERTFSSLREVLTDDRISCKEDLINAQMLIRCTNKLKR